MGRLLRAVRMKRSGDCTRRCVRCAGRQTAAGPRPKRSESSRPLPSSRSVTAEPHAKGRASSRSKTARADRPTALVRAHACQVPAATPRDHSRDEADDRGGRRHKAQGEGELVPHDRGSCARERREGVHVPP